MRGAHFSLPVVIEDGVWIGANVVVMPGVTIGSNVVIGGGSVVVNDIPDGVLAVGDPCRVVRTLTEKDEPVSNWIVFLPPAMLAGGFLCLLLCRF